MEQICLNGHLHFSDSKETHCPDCGEELIEKCSCGKQWPSIKAANYISPGGISAGGPRNKLRTMPHRDSSSNVYQQHHEQKPFKIPSFCSYCGTSYEWTSRRQNELRDLITESVNADVADKLEQYIPAIIADEPKAQIAAMILKKLDIVTPMLIKSFAMFSAEFAKHLSSP